MTKIRNKGMKSEEFDNAVAFLHCSVFVLFGA